MLDVHRLRIFRSVVATGSINAAAANLGYTPSAVSQHLAALQRETGLTLVARVGRGIQPTAAGLALADRIDELLDRLGQVESLVADLRAGRHGSLSITYFASVGSAWMPTVVRALLRDFPTIRLRLSLRDDIPVDPTERADVQVLVERDGLNPGPGTRAHHLFVDPYVAVLPRTHPLAEHSSIELAKLADEDWVDNDMSRGWCRRNLIEACRAAGFAPPFRVEAHDYPTAIAFVDAGIGITVLPGLAARNLPPSLVGVPVTGPTPRRNIYALVQTTVEDTPPVRAVLAALRECAGQPAGRSVH
ncbi:MAG: LysR family transcriptional regulator [Micromonosporaceae bacterium]|nr:LysR family transcriptional regulator [Micromonosporaceae bacterium]